MYTEVEDTRFPQGDEQEQLVPIVRGMMHFLNGEAGSYRKNTNVATYRLVVEMLGGFQPNDLRGNAEKMRHANELIEAAINYTPSYE
jgi:hypothetical protein